MPAGSARPGASSIGAMGANSISEYISKTEQIRTAGDAFDYLHSRDLHDCGHGGYTGSWAEVPGIQRAPGIPAMMREQARIVADKAFDSDGGPRKWEAGHWIPVVAAEPGSERNVEVVLSEAQRLEAGAERGVRDLETLGRLLGRRDGEQFAALEIGPTSVRREVEAHSVPGRTETRYFVSFGGRLDLRWEAGFATASQARKALLATLEAATARTKDLAGEIIAVRRRENGDPLIAGTARVTSSATPIKATFAVPSAEIVGWMLYAVASD